MERDTSRSDRYSVNIDGPFINEVALADQSLGSAVRRWIANTLLLRTACPFCQTRLRHESVVEGTRTGEHFDPVLLRVQLSFCPNCRYWHWYRFLYDDGPYRTESEKTAHDALLSKQREFENALPDPCNEELAQAFRRHPDLWHSVDPTRFEQFVAAVFRANHRQAEVRHVGRSADGGTDVIFVDDAQRRWLIQVKRRTHPNAAEPVGTVRSLLGTLVLEGQLRGIVVSTADHFSYAATAGSRRASERGYTIDLVDRGILNRMLDPLLPSEPWKAEDILEFSRVNDGPMVSRQNIFADGSAVYVPYECRAAY